MKDKNIKTVRVKTTLHNKIKAIAAIRNQTIEDLTEHIFLEFFEKNKGELKK